MATDYSTEKARLLTVLRDIERRLAAMENDFGMDFSELRGKVTSATETTQHEKLSVAVFGAFSDGKSSVIASATGITDIEIDPTPTTDAVHVYDLPDFRIVDTPGLFSGIQPHDARTRNYISEAHVVLYVCEASVPVKASNKPMLAWLLNDLGKLDATIFVLNKMDEVVDLEDDEEFGAAVRTKSGVLNTIVREVAEGREATRIICIAADPHQRGQEHWRKRPDDYARLSRMPVLRAQVDTFVALACDELRRRAGISAIGDVIDRASHDLGMGLGVVQDNNVILLASLKETRNEVEKLDRQATMRLTNIRERVFAYRDNLFASVQGAASARDLRDFVARQLGDQGYVLEENINRIIREETEALAAAQEAAMANLEASSALYDALIAKAGQMLGAGASALGKKVAGASVATLKEVVLMARDAVGKLTGTVFKFKPWQATKWAKGLQGLGSALVYLPIVMDTIEVIAKEWNAAKLEKQRQELSKSLDDVFKAFAESFDEGSFRESYAPALAILQKSKAALEKGVDENQQLLAQGNSALEGLEALKLTCVAADTERTAAR